MDTISQSRIKKLHPKFRPLVEQLLKKAEERGIKLRITSGLRTFEEQQALYDQGRTKPGGIVTNAKPGSSYHNYGLAIDVVELDEKGNGIWENPNWPIIGQIGKSLGLVWGGDFKSIVDKPHFELSKGYTIASLLAMHNSKRLDSEGYVLLS